MIDQDGAAELSGGYDIGYRATPCFWGTNPGSLVVWLTEHVDVAGFAVLDAGCGEGKNAVYLASLGASVAGWDTSEAAIANGLRTWGSIPNVQLQQGDVLTADLPAEGFDLIVAYGLFHCLSDASVVEQLVRRLDAATRPDGYHVVCAFNERRQEFRGAHHGFNPLLLAHSDYLSLYRGWEILTSSDEDLVETHPNDGIEHLHSLTRLVARKCVG